MVGRVQKVMNPTHKAPRAPAPPRPPLPCARGASAPRGLVAAEPPARAARPQGCPSAPVLLACPPSVPAPLRGRSAAGAAVGLAVVLGLCGPPLRPCVPPQPAAPQPAGRSGPPRSRPLSAAGGRSRGGLTKCHGDILSGSAVILSGVNLSVPDSVGCAIPR